MATFASELRRLREAAGISGTRLAAHVQCHRTHIANLEAGRKLPSAELAAALDQRLDAHGTLASLIPTTEELSLGPDAAASLRPAQLPFATAGFIGRDTEITQLEQVLADGTRVEVISGTAGVGKSAIALRFAHSIAHRFPGGALYANLAGNGPDAPADPAEVLTRFLHALGQAPEQTPHGIEDRARRFRTAARRRGVLVVLDDAASAEQVRPLLPDAPNSLALITTRQQVSDLIAWHGAHRLIVAPFTTDQARTLLREHLDRDATAAELTRLASYCAFLPLALRVAVERINTRPNEQLGDLIDQLDDERHRLDHLVAEDHAVKTVLAWSYRGLPKPAQHLFRLLGLHPGNELCVGGAAALLGEPRSTVRPILDLLTQGNLATEVRGGRYRLHDLLHLYAQERAQADETADVRQQARHRLLHWYLHITEKACHTIVPSWREPLATDHDTVEPETFRSSQRAFEWFDVNTDNITAAVRAAADHGFDDLAWKIAVAAWDYYTFRKLWGPWVETHTIGLAAAQRQGTLHGQACMHHNLGAAALDLYHWDRAKACFTAARRLAQQAGNDEQAAWAEFGLGRTAMMLTNYDEALVHQHAALDHFATTGTSRGRALARADRAVILHARGNLQAAIRDFRQAIELAHQLGDTFVEGHIVTHYATALRNAGNDADAVAQFHVALELHRRIGHRHGEAIALDNLAHLLYRAGDTQDADTYWHTAESILDELNDPGVEDLRKRWTDAVSAASAPSN